MAKKIGIKKQALSDLTLKLSMALPELKKTLGEKKFERRIKKAAKLLNAGIKPEAVSEKKPKTTKKKAAENIAAEQ